MQNAYLPHIGCRICRLHTCLVMITGLSKLWHDRSGSLLQWCVLQHCITTYISIRWYIDAVLKKATYHPNYQLNECNWISRWSPNLARCRSRNQQSLTKHLGRQGHSNPNARKSIDFDLRLNPSTILTNKPSLYFFEHVYVSVWNVLNYFHVKRVCSVRNKYAKFNGLEMPNLAVNLVFFHRSK